MQIGGSPFDAAPRAPSTRPAAFFRLEGVMHPAGAWEAAAYVAANAASMRRRLLGMGGAVVSGALRGVSLAGAGLVGARSTRLAYSVLAGFSRDRLEVLGEDYARDVLVRGARPSALRLVEGARRDGFTTVLIAEASAEVADAFARALAKDGPSFDLVLANHLELDDRGRATGALVDPVIAPEVDPRRLRAIAAEHGFDLEASRAYGHAHADLVLLGLVGHPCAIEPDRELARVARDLDWPIVRAEAPFDPPTPSTRRTHDEGAPA